MVIKGHRRSAGSTWIEIHYQVLEESIHTNSADANKQVLLTEPEAKKFIRTRDYKSLLSYTAIDEPAAKVLSGFDGSLALWIRAIPDGAAHAMSKHIGLLVLNFFPSCQMLPRKASVSTKAIFSSKDCVLYQMLLLKV